MLANYFSTNYTDIQILSGVASHSCACYAIQSRNIQVKDKKSEEIKLSLKKTISSPMLNLEYPPQSSTTSLSLSQLNNFGRSKQNKKSSCPWTDGS
jgi:hypothetical protein